LIRSRVAGVTDGLSRSARDTVIALTPASAAICSIVTGLLTSLIRGNVVHVQATAVDPALPGH
jgi:LytS/YehU family sensor histidine kinase